MTYYRDTATGSVLSMDRNLIQITEEDYLAGLVYAWVNDSAQAHEANPGGQPITREQYEWYRAQRTQGYMASYSETLAMQRTAVVFTLEQARTAKIAGLDAWRFAAIATGYTDETGRTWGIDDRDRSAWQELLTAATALLGLSDQDNLPTFIREIDGTTMHKVSLGEYRSILRGVAAAYMQIDADYATLRMSILSAATIEELEAVELPST